MFNFFFRKQPKKPSNSKPKKLRRQLEVELLEKRWLFDRGPLALLDDDLGVIPQKRLFDDPADNDLSVFGPRSEPHPGSAGSSLPSETGHGNPVGDVGGGNGSSHQTISQGTDSGAAAAAPA